MMEEEMVVEEEPAMEEEPVMEEEVEAAPMSAEVSMAVGSSLPGCEETNECYIPYVVTISVGGTVTWTNDDTAAHTVTSGTVTEGPDGIFDSSIVMAGKTFEHTFDEASTYDYFCVVHPWMTGQVVVE
jgi:plastocyanin